MLTLTRVATRMRVDFRDSRESGSFPSAGFSPLAPWSLALRFRFSASILTNNDAVKV